MKHWSIHMSAVPVRSTLLAYSVPVKVAVPFAFDTFPFWLSEMRNTAAASLLLEFILALPFSMITTSDWGVQVVGSWSRFHGATARLFRSTEAPGLVVVKSKYRTAFGPVG